MIADKDTVKHLFCINLPMHLCSFLNGISETNKKILKHKKIQACIFYYSLSRLISVSGNVIFVPTTGYKSKWWTFTLQCVFENGFLYFSTKTLCCVYSQKSLNETVLLSTQNRFKLMGKKIISILCS